MLLGGIWSSLLYGGGMVARYPRHGPAARQLAHACVKSAAQPGCAKLKTERIFRYLKYVNVDILYVRAQIHTYTCKS
jgi:hypothetical protein